MDFKTQIKHKNFPELADFMIKYKKVNGNCRHLQEWKIWF